MSNSYWEDRYREKEEECWKLRQQLAQLDIPLKDLLLMVNEQGIMQIDNNDPRIHQLKAALNNEGYEFLTEHKALAQAIDDHLRRLSDNSYYGYDRPLVDRLNAVLRTSADSLNNQLSGIRAFRDDMITWLRAINIVIGMVGNGATHAEKAARLRGIAELIDGYIDKLRQEQFDFSHDWRLFADVFRSDLPTRGYVARIHELEEKIKELEQKEAA